MIALVEVSCRWKIGVPGGKVIVEGKAIEDSVALKCRNEGDTIVACTMSGERFGTREEFIDTMLEELRK